MSIKIENDKNNFLWITKECSGSLLLGSKTQEEVEEENKKYVENELNEETKK